MNPKTALLSLGSLAALATAAPLVWDIHPFDATSALEAPRQDPQPASAASAVELEALAARGADEPDSRDAAGPAGAAAQAAGFEEKYRYADRDALDIQRAALATAEQKLANEIMWARMRAGLSTRYQGKVGERNELTPFAIEDAKYWHPGTEPRVSNSMVMSIGHATYQAVSLVEGDYPEYDPVKAELNWLQGRIRELDQAARPPRKK